MSITSKLVYGIRLDREAVGDEKLEELEEITDDHGYSTFFLHLESLGNAYDIPEIFLVFRDYGWESPNLQQELPSGSSVKKISDRPVPSADKIEEAKAFFDEHGIAWEDPDWFSAVNIG